MVRAHRLTTTAVLIACLVGTSTGILFASDDVSSSVAASASPSADRLTTAKEDGSAILPGTTEFLRSVGAPAPPLVLNDRTLTASNVFAQRGYRGRGGYAGRNNNGAAAAIIVGAAAAIAGTALLVYANRPECSTTPTAGGCGYGAKVLGGAVLTGGVVGVTIGALTWR
jgi:hypothetical protein